MEPRTDRAPVPRAAIRTPRDLAPLIDHTLLKPDAGAADIHRLCGEAREHRFATVCVRPEWIELAAQLVGGSSVKPIAVVDFPLGAGSPQERVDETRRVVAAGAAEVDVVLLVTQLHARAYRIVLDDLEAVVRAARVPVKVIIEAGALSNAEKAAACALAKTAGAAWVKTSTGFGKGGATAQDVALMREVVGHELGVKASGGIRTAADALRMVEAGASRVGASASVAIVTASSFA
jgi:deoxyribose-phosphate aldolase